MSKPQLHLFMLEDVCRDSHAELADKPAENISLLDAYAAMGMATPPFLRAAIVDYVMKNHAAWAAKEKPSAATDVDAVLQFWSTFALADMPMLSTQAYRLYLKWCEGAGREALTLPRMVFCLISHGLARNRRKRYQGFEFAVVHGPAGFLIPAVARSAPNDQPETAWLGQCVRQVDKYLKEMNA